MSGREGIRVIHVDDERDFAELAADMLEREDDRFDIETVTSASDGLDRLADEEYDCVVSDYDMPGQNGIDFLKAVREDHPNLPFILYTGKGSEEIASDAISAGVTEYLQKGSGTGQYAVLANRVINAVEKYRAQTELAEREKRLNLFIEQSPLGVIKWDDNFHIARVNEAAEDILGFEADELIGCSWEAIVPEADAEAVGEVVSALLEARGGYHSINENVREDGEHIVCEWHNRVVTDEAGEVVAIFSQFQDITERKEEKRRSEQRRRRLEQILKTVPACVVQLNPSGEFVFANDRAEEVLGLEPDDVTDRAYNDPEWNIKDLEGNPIPDEELPFRRVADTGTPLHDVRHVIEWPDGTRKILLVSGAPLMDDDGAVEKVIFALTDVTEEVVRKRRLEATLENTTAPLFMKNRDGEYLLVNKGWRELFGLENTEVRGRTDTDLFHPEMAAEVQSNDQKVIETGDPVNEEERILIDGEERMFLTSKTPVYDIGNKTDPENPVALFGVANDITEQKERERRLQRQNERFDELAGAISHDLQTPLATASGRAELAIETGDTEQMEQALDAIERADELRESLVEVLRTGEVANETESVSIEPLADDAWNTVSATDNVSLEVCDEFVVDADPHALQRLFENLFSNAVNHTDGAVTVRVGRTDDGFFIDDDGPGIPDHARDKVFRPGYSIDSSGDGVGLASVKQIAMSHGWDIDITENDEGGARFEIGSVEFSTE
jgi:PAS domain S-box-containing protein